MFTSGIVYDKIHTWIQSQHNSLNPIDYVPNYRPVKSIIIVKHFYVTCWYVRIGIFGIYLLYSSLTYLPCLKQNSVWPFVIGLKNMKPAVTYLKQWHTMKTAMVANSTETVLFLFFLHVFCKLLIIRILFLISKIVGMRLPISKIPASQ